MGAPRPASPRPGFFTRIRVARGFSFVELLVVSAMLAVLASAVLPLSKVTMQRQREAQLRRGLRDLRTAIDRYKDAVTLQQIGGTNVEAGSEGYPPDLETLVEGVERMNDASGTTMKFLRRIPYDPMTRSNEWGLRAYQDEPHSTRWSGDNVYDVYSTSNATALDGTKYNEW
jgi:general secretion pathway protein G